MHGGRYHIIGVAQACHVRIREIRSQYGIDELLAVRSLVGRHVCKVRTREIHLGIIGVPVESGLSASFGVTFKGRGHRTICQIFIDVDVARRSGKCHADVPVMVEYGLISVAPFGSRPSGPCSPVGWNPVTVLVIVPFSFFLRTPIDFGDNDGVRIYYRHRLSELLDERFPIGILVAVIIPSHVGMHSVAYIIAFDGIALITSVIALPSRPGHPNDTVETVGTYLVHDGLEEIIRGACAFQTVGIVNVHRFVGQFNGHLPAMFLDVGIARNDVPHLQQVVLIVPVYFDATGAYAGRTHDYIKPMVQCLFYDFPIERGQIRAKPFLTELRDIGLAGFFSRNGKVRIIRPTRIQMKPEHIAIGSLRGIRNSREELVEILDAVFFGSIVGSIPPTVIIKIRAWRIHHAVQHHFVAMGVCQILPVYMNGRRNFRAHRNCRQQQSGKHKVFHSSHN